MTKNQDKKISFPNQVLPPFEDLLKLADITEYIIEGIVQEWRDNPPDEEFVNILDAETEEN